MTLLQVETVKAPSCPTLMGVLQSPWDPPCNYLGEELLARGEGKQEDAKVMDWT